MADLTTTYMGLTLKSPIVPSASPLSKSVAGIAQMADAGAAAVTMYSLFEEQITLEAISLHNRLEQGSWNYAEALTYYPKASDYNRGPGRLPGPDPRGEEGRGRAGHRQPERHHDGRLDRLRAEDRAGGRGRARAERLPDPDDERRDRQPGRADLPGRAAGRQEERAHSGGDEAEPLLLVDARTWRSGWTRRARMRSCCSTGSTSRTSTWKS